jgi:hypothetical protein
MAEDEQAIMCVLMLRGAQTPGELKQRTERMHAFAELAAVQDTLGALIARELVARLDRRPGHKEERYTQLLQEDGEDQPTSQAPAQLTPAGESPELEALRARVQRLEREVAELRAGMRNPVYEHQP